MNKVILMGRIVRDPEVRYSQGQNASVVAKYSLAVPRRFKQEGQPDADFINCTCFGKQAEFAERYLRQGTKIAVTGRIQTGSYTDKNGNKVYTTDIVVEEQEFAESKPSTQKESVNTQPAPIPTPSNLADGFLNIPDGIDEELPFQ